MGLSTSFITSSESSSFSVCDGRGPQPYLNKDACNCLAWAGWASLGGGEVGQLVAMVTAAAPCQLPISLPQTSPTDELLCPV